MATPPSAPPPDDKNWTWVLERPCPECGFDASQHRRERFGAEVRSLAGTYRRLLGSANATRRPSPEVWSALEYACHVRDVFDVFLQRLRLMITQDGPTFANWDQDETAIAGRYWEQDPERVAYALAVNAGKVADTFDQVRDDQWQRRGVRSDGSEFTIETLGLYLLHDPIHHVWDIERGEEALAEG
jgi:hypothetical protein